MKSKEFDDLVRASFEKASLPYNHENWQKLSATLDEKKGGRKKFLLWPLASIAASVALAVGVTVWINQEDNEIAGVISTARNIPAISDNTPTALAAKENASANITPVSTTVKIARQTQVLVTPPIANTAAPQLVVAPVIPKEPEETIIGSPVVVSTTHAEEQANIFRSKTVDAPIIEKKTVKPVASLVSKVSYNRDITPVQQSGKRFVTMAGGLNYGTLNSGYVMGFSAGTRLSDKFYVESDVAFVGNIAGEKTKHSFVPKVNPLAKTTSYTTATTVTVQRFYNLYYAQVTPTLGYKVARSLSVGVGADIQRLLMDDVLVTETADPEDAKQLPVLDMGLVGKTEYNLTKEIKASVYYRKAMNQPLTGNNKLLDRDYLQLQLKFTIFNR